MKKTILGLLLLVAITFGQTVISDTILTVDNCRKGDCRPLMHRLILLPISYRGGVDTSIVVLQMWFEVETYKEMECYLYGKRFNFDGCYTVDCVENSLDWVCPRISAIKPAFDCGYNRNCYTRDCIRHGNSTITRFKMKPGYENFVDKSRIRE